MTIWQLSEGALLKCAVCRAGLSATLLELSPPASVPNVAQSERFRAVDAKSSFSNSAGTKRESLQLWQKLAGHLQNSTFQVMVVLLPLFGREVHGCANMGSLKGIPAESSDTSGMLSKCCNLFPCQRVNR